MIKKVFLPLWSFNIEKTEAWLNRMANEGYHFIKLNTGTRHFLFNEGDPLRTTHHIEYDKMQTGTISSTLKEAGWELSLQHKKWQFLKNDNPADDIVVFPAHKGVTDRNRKLMYTFGIMATPWVLSTINMAFIAMLIFLFPGHGTIVGSPYWTLTFIFWIVGLFIFYSFILLFKTIERLELGKTKQSVMKPLSKNEMVALKRSKGLIKKRKFGWMYAPDKLEMWLEEMEEQGYNLYRVSRMGTTFLFAKGSPQQVAYRADYQNNLTNSYYELHKDAGWELLYTSNQLLNKWSIWAYPYEQEESVPQIYSDKTQLIKHAKRVAITHLSLFIPVIIMYLSLIMMEIFYSSRNEMYSYNWFTFIISGILIIEFGTFSLRSWLYYRRIKKG